MSRLPLVAEETPTDRKLESYSPTEGKLDLAEHRVVANLTTPKSKTGQLPKVLSEDKIPQSLQGHPLELMDRCPVQN